MISLEFTNVDETQVERMTAHDPVEKEMATEKKEARKQQSELEKQEARMHNAASKQAERIGAHGGAGYATTGTGAPATYTTTGGTEYPPTRTEDVMETHPVGIDRGTGRTTAQNLRVEGTGPTHGTGGTYR